MGSSAERGLQGTSQGPKEETGRSGPWYRPNPSTHKPSEEVQLAGMTGRPGQTQRTGGSLSAWQGFLVTACSAVPSPGPYLRHIT